MGQIAFKLAKLRHNVTLADPSEEVLSKARAAVQRERLANVNIICSDAQTLAQHIDETFDLVICHAVLEWVVSPNKLIKALGTFLRPQGKLSPMFLNGHSQVFKAAIWGDFETYSSPEKAKSAEHGTPILTNASALSGARGLSTKTVAKYLNEHRLVPNSKAGIRIFHDYIPRHLKRNNLTELLQLEINYRRTEPFASLAQHIHLVCSRNVT